jgi:hypothetical protein
MQETKETILAMLGDANGLKSYPYGPDSSAPDTYIAPGNYANAESVERKEINAIGLPILLTGKRTT